MLQNCPGESSTHNVPVSSSAWFFSEGDEASDRYKPWSLSPVKGADEVRVNQGASFPVIFQGACEELLLQDCFSCPCFHLLFPKNWFLILMAAVTALESETRNYDGVLEIFIGACCL